MNGDRPRAWGLWVLRATALAMLLLLGVNTAAADPQPGPTSIRVTAELTSGFEVTASGLLTDSDGRAVPDATVQAKLSGTAVGGATTTDAGTYQFSFTLPEDMRTGEHQLVVVFGGRGELEASQAATTIQTGESPPETEPPSDPSPPADLPDVRLEVSLAPNLVPLGGLVMVEGTLTNESGEGIPDGKIVLLLDGKESADSLVLTGEQGEFQTFAEVPANQPEGVAELVVSFAGNYSYDPLSETFTITVEELTTAADPNASASPTESATAQDSATAEALPDSTVETTVDSKNNPDGRDPLSWFYVALISVGGIALLVAGALVFRSMYMHRDVRKRDEGSLDHLLQEAGGEDEADLLSEAFVEEALPDDGGETAADLQDGPAEGGSPSRSAD